MSAKPVTVTSENAAELLAPVFEANRIKLQEQLDGFSAGLETKILAKAKTILVEELAKALPKPSVAPVEEQKAEDPAVTELRTQLAALTTKLATTEQELAKASGKSNQPAVPPVSFGAGKDFDVNAAAKLLSGKV